MWKQRYKRKEEAEPTGRGDHSDAPPSKKAASTDDEDGILVCELAKNRKVKVRKFAGKLMVDIREFYIKDGVELPGKKGISLSMDQWDVLREHIEEIDQAVSENA